jgi:septal ring factor EnvC (AmiA/AmiB activator)
VRYLRRYGEWRKSQAELLEQQRNATHEAKQLLELVRVDHEIILEDLDKERASLAQRQQEQETQIANLQKRNKELQTELDRDRKRMAEVEKTIQRMIEEEIRKAEEARKKAEEEARRKEEAARKAREAKEKGTATASKGSTSGTSTSTSKSTGTTTAPSRNTTHNSATVKKDDAFRRLSGSFAENRGRLPYPLDATFAFVDHYNPNNGNSSIVLSTRVGAHACAIYEGVVQSCFRTSEEWTIIVQHGNYRSVYMNLQNVFVRAGQKVSTRQQLGTLKTEPESNRAEIRFWIYQNSTAVNPERWLKR